MLHLTLTEASDPAIEELCDHVVAFGTILQMMTSPAEALAMELGRRIAAIRARQAAHPALPALQLRARLGLSESEATVIALLAAVAIDGDVRGLLASRYGCVAPNGQPGDPNLEAIRRVIYGECPTRAAQRELGPDGTLRRLGVIERTDGGGAEVSDGRRTFAIAQVVQAMLHGEEGLDAALAGCARRGHAAPIDALEVEGEARERLVRALGGATPTVIVLAGATGVGRRSLATASLASLGRGALEIDVSALPRDAVGLTAVARRIARDCRIFGLTPVLTGLELLATQGGDGVDRMAIVGRELVGSLPGHVLATSRPQPATMRWGRPVAVIDLPATTSAIRAVLWRRALGHDVGSAEDLDYLVSHYPLAPAMIVRAGEAAHATAAAQGRELEASDLLAGISVVLDDTLGNLASRVRTTQRWEDVVLGEDQHAAVRELIARIRHRRTVHEAWGYARKVGKGLGLAALFSGPPGTGKTMIAGLIAQELGLPLYQVDLAKIVSRYVGETEKQLAQLFDAAEAGQAILLFDEADALFGKRTEVKSSNDRYANLETNYLLQRLETFTGICLLTTNHEHNLDPAIARRLALHVRFEVPDEAERACIWRAVLPVEAPVDGGLDVTGLARRYVLSGGYIRNAAMRAAFFAADEGVRIGLSHLTRAAKLEAEGAGQVVAG
jgi:hypothetical protein